MNPRSTAKDMIASDVWLVDNNQLLTGKGLKGNDRYRNQTHSECFPAMDSDLDNQRILISSSTSSSLSLCRKGWFERFHHRPKRCDPIAEKDNESLLRNDSSTLLLRNSISSIDSNVSLNRTTSSTTKRTTTKPIRPIRRVSFSVAEYREYNVTVGVSNDVSFALTLDWSYGKSKWVKLSNRDDPVRWSNVMSLQPLNTRKRQQRLLTMGLSRERLVALERRRQILLAAEWAFGNHADMRPTFASGKILQYSIH